MQPIIGKSRVVLKKFMSVSRLKPNAAVLSVKMFFYGKIIKSWQDEGVVFGQAAR